VIGVTVNNIAIEQAVAMNELIGEKFPDNRYDRIHPDGSPTRRGFVSYDLASRLFFGGPWSLSQTFFSHRSDPTRRHICPPDFSICNDDSRSATHQIL